MLLGTVYSITCQSYHFCVATFGRFVSKSLFHRGPFHLKEAALALLKCCKGNSSLILNKRCQINQVLLQISRLKVGRSKFQTVQSFQRAYKTQMACPKNAHLHRLHFSAKCFHIICFLGDSLQPNVQYLLNYLVFKVKCEIIRRGSILK